MEPIGVIAVAIGVLCFILIAVVSMSGPPPRRSERDRDRFIPGNWHPDDGDGGWHHH